MPTKRGALLSDGATKGERKASIHLASSGTRELQPQTAVVLNGFPFVAVSSVRGSDGQNCPPVEAAAIASDVPQEREAAHTAYDAARPAAMAGPTLLRGSIAILDSARRTRQRTWQSVQMEGRWLWRHRGCCHACPLRRNWPCKPIEAFVSVSDWKEHFLPLKQPR